MEDDLKILNIEYLSNHWSDLIQMLNDPNGRQPQNIKSRISYPNFKLKTKDKIYILGFKILQHSP